MCCCLGKCKHAVPAQLTLSKVLKPQKCSNRAQRWAGHSSRGGALLICSWERTSLSPQGIKHIFDQNSGLNPAFLLTVLLVPVVALPLPPTHEMMGDAQRKREAVNSYLSIHAVIPTLWYLVPVLVLRHRWKTERESDLFICSSLACSIGFYPHRPLCRFIACVLRTRPSCLCCCCLFAGFVFCITRTNLIRAKGIQISAQPPNTIWSPNKGLGERKERRTNALSTAEENVRGTGAS